jgi:antirestriction protein ArdC
MDAKINAALSSILEQFNNGNIPEIVSYSMFPTADDIPSAAWSLLNRTLMFMAGTSDARGFRQWNEVGRHVKKGEKAQIFILVPFFKKRKDEEADEEVRFLSGFGSKAVFAYEQTEGDPLSYRQIEVPELPLLERAKEWGLSVKAVPGSYKYFGYYAPGRKEIALATNEEGVFFHELAHAAHERVKGPLKPGQDPLQEIVAELSAQALCRIVGKEAKDTLGNSYRYIGGYADKAGLSALTACVRVLSEVEQVLGLILAPLA